MIELNDETQQDFLNREWVQKLLDAGVDMSDAKYNIGQYHWNRLDENDYVFQVSEWDEDEDFYNTVPTYTASELIYKLHKYHCSVSSSALCTSQLGIMGFLASLLIQCHKKDIDMTTKDTDDISDK